jgi:MoxR-like ATPase
MNEPVTAAARVEADRERLAAIRTALGVVIQGKPDAIELLLVGVLAGGHVLVEDVPGVGKTTLAKALARVFRMAYSRVQFTPDLLPADILGAQVLDPREGSFSFHKGPVFSNVLLADEINRASPRTQSALLEAMSEAQVTVDGVTHPLPAPFFVLATQNPNEYSGTSTRSPRRSSIASSCAWASATRRPTPSSRCSTRGSGWIRSRPSSPSRTRRSSRRCRPPCATSR